MKSIQLKMQITCFSEFDCANIINCDEHLTSSLHKSWLCTVHSNIMHNYANVHGIVVFGFLTTSITTIINRWTHRIPVGLCISIT